MDEHLSDSHLDNKASNKYAGFWVRYAAFQIDLIPWSIYYLITINFISKESPLFSLAPNIGIIGLILYFIVSTSLYGKTLGKKIFGLKVVKDEKKPSVITVLVREIIGKFISSFLFLGFIWVGIDKNKQGFHDKIASTYVISEFPIKGFRKFLVFLFGILFALQILGGLAAITLLAISPKLLNLNPTSPPSGNVTVNESGTGVYEDPENGWSISYDQTYFMKPYNSTVLGPTTDITFSPNGNYCMGSLRILVLDNTQNLPLDMFIVTRGYGGYVEKIEINGKPGIRLTATNSINVNGVSREQKEYYHYIASGSKVLELHYSDSYNWDFTIEQCREAESRLKTVINSLKVS